MSLTSLSKLTQLITASQLGEAEHYSETFVIEVRDRHMLPSAHLQSEENTKIWKYPLHC